MIVGRMVFLGVLFTCVTWFFTLCGLLGDASNEDGC